MIEMEKNARLKEKSAEKSAREAIQQYKDNMTLRGHLKNIGIISCLALFGIAIGYFMLGWLVIPTMVIGGLSILGIRYIWGALLPWEWERAIRYLESNEGFEKKCSKCGSSKLKGYPGDKPVEYVCLDCGHWTK